MLKLIHGYGSTGVGGDIRIAVQKRLRELADNGQIRSLHLWGELVEIRRRSLAASAIPSGVKERLRSRPTKSRHHDRCAVARKVL